MAAVRAADDFAHDPVPIHRIPQVECEECHRPTIGRKADARVRLHIRLAGKVMLIKVIYYSGGVLYFVILCEYQCSILA